MRPDLITIYAGGNDLLRPKVDIDALMERYDAALGKLAASGAHLVIWKAHDPKASRMYQPLRGRFANYNALARELAETHDPTLIHFWRLRDSTARALWAADRQPHNYFAPQPNRTPKIRY